MKRALLLPAIIAALALPSGSAPAQQRRPAAVRDWTQVVSQTPEGGYRIGNPAAAIKVVEYFSLTCPHCAEFAHESGPRLIPTYVRSGRVSFEYRNYYLNGVDMIAAALSRCAPPRSYFALTDAMLASQATWMGRVSGMSAAERQRITALPMLEQMRAVLSAAGLDALAARHGVNAQQFQACFATRAGVDRLEQMRAAGAGLGINGTPTFSINGRLVETNVWAGIEPLLRGQ
jgi:protein-disulfide isomerase